MTWPSKKSLKEKKRRKKKMWKQQKYVEYTLVLIYLFSNYGILTLSSFFMISHTSIIMIKGINYASWLHGSLKYSNASTFMVMSDILWSNHSHMINYSGQLKSCECEGKRNNKNLYRGPENSQLSLEQYQQKATCLTKKICQKPSRNGKTGEWSKTPPERLIQGRNFNIWHKLQLVIKSKIP